MGEIVTLDVTNLQEDVTYAVTESGTVEISVVAEKGTDGTNGTNGTNGGSTSAWNYKAKTNATSGYPGNGYLLWNDATQTSATSILVSHLNDDDTDLELLLSFFTVGQKLFIQDRDESANNQVWEISGTPTLTGAGTTTAYFTFPVTLVSSAGAAFTNNHQLLFGSISVATNAVTSATTTNFTSGNVLYANSGNVGSLSRIGIDTRFIFPNDAPLIVAALPTTDVNIIVENILVHGTIDGNFTYNGASNDRPSWQYADGLFTGILTFDGTDWTLSISYDASPIYFARMADVVNPTAPSRLPWDAVALDGATWNELVDGDAPQFPTAYALGTLVQYGDDFYQYTGYAWDLIVKTSDIPAALTLGTGVQTALAVNVGSAGSIVVNGGALGTPSSGTLTSCTGLPISTGVSGLGTNVATFLGSPTSANLAACLTDETGTGANVFATSPTITTPIFAGHALSTTSIYKPSNETRSSNTLAADTDLAIPLAANSNYLIEVLIEGALATAGGTFSIQARYTGTLDAAITTSSIAMVAGGGSALAAGVFLWSNVVTPTIPIFSGSTTTPRGNVFKFKFRTANAGNFVFDWSNGNGTGSGSGSWTLRQGSYMTATRIA